ncbi:MAG: TIR domain-containing protein [Clostridia bacterium]|nr:TIR domain-containing protein [Clostridia bacterium]
MRPLVYEGNEPYVFISYAHKDTEMVFQVVEELQQQGIRIWYDEGITPGSEWPENVATHLYNAGMVIAFITPRSMESENCRREINFALSKKKPFLSVVLEETRMSIGMEMQLSARQSILRYNYTTWKTFIDKILNCPDLVPCCESAHESDNNGKPDVTSTKIINDLLTEEEREFEIMKILYEAASFEVKNDYISELACLIKGIKIAPDNATLLVRIGRAYRRLGFPSRALEYYEKAKAASPEDPTIYANIAAAYMASGLYEKAKPLFLHGLALYEKNPIGTSQSDIATLNGNYALCLGITGDLSSAKKHLRKAKELGYSQSSIDSICKRLNISFN